MRRAPPKPQNEKSTVETAERKNAAEAAEQKNAAEAAETEKRGRSRLSASCGRLDRISVEIEEIASGKATSKPPEYSEVGGRY
jgi:hypothetical protein